ncbi:MAG: ATP-binding protein [Litoreibacter sp.]|nr:ATP-binding protein [Litoreibacter sp.]
MTKTQNSEIKRQQKYLDRLPDDYQFPLFNTKQALQSQRQNGYKNTAAAAREIVDNALEAGAKHVDVVLCRPDQRHLKKHDRKNAVSAVAFVDDGPGMLPQMARYALSWGGGTHFDDHKFIGKFGFGLPNASINQTTKVAVYTRTDADEPISVVALDLDAFGEHGVQQIPEPAEGYLPEFVVQALDKLGREFVTGTVVIWDKPDRLTYRMAAELKSLLVDDFGSTYRNHLKDFVLTVDGTKVEAVDPLFTSPEMKYYLPEKEGGAIVTLNKSIPLRYYVDESTGGRHLSKPENEGELENEGEMTLATGAAHVRVVRFPVGFVEGKKRKKTDLTDAHRRWQVRKSRRGMCFVRAGREIETVDAFPRSAKDQSSGLGYWPLLQGYAYHWGIEVSFQPSLDGVFGITNDKQTVRPLEDFWRILAQEKIDEHLRRENAWQTKEREKADTEKAKEADKERETKPTPGELAAAAANVVSGRPPAVPDTKQDEVDEVTQIEAARRAKETKQKKSEVEEAMKEERRRRPYRVTFEDNPNGPFYEPAYGHNGQILAKINTAHPFYTNVYSQLIQKLGGEKVRDTIDLLLLMLSQSELEAPEPMLELFYSVQRTEKWSPFLKNALTILENDIADTLDPDENLEPDEAPDEDAA